MIPWSWPSSEEGPLKILKRSHLATFYMAGEPIDLKLTVPNHADSKDLLALIQSKDPFAALVSEPGQVEAIFERFVQLVEPMQTDDGKDLSSGKDLIPVISTGVLMEIITRLATMSSDTKQLGKASASPSTSGSEGNGQPSSDSPARSTESEAGIVPSTATEIEAAPA
jgi:hypothetical protein